MVRCDEGSILHQELSRKRVVYKKHEHVHISAYTGDGGDRKSTTGYCTFVRRNPVIWRSKKQDVSRSSAEAEDKGMSHTSCEMVWL